DVLPPSLADATALADRLARLPEVDHAVTLASFVPEQQQEKLALIGDAALLLEPVLNPAVVKPPPNDAEIVHATLRAARSLEQAPSADAKRLARARGNVAADAATRDRSRLGFV